ncbi:MAG: 3-oxoacyl-ACP synthase III family protein [Xenococcaceae cyanobacterium MO_188.B32]|nr:3-oxoacyl-ACP synthase III family protein [Xenococcaceae cyanobacterium MO_188.B32]
MNFKPVGIRAIAVSFPSIIRTNDYYRQHHPELVAKAEEKTLARTFSLVKSDSEDKALDIWTEEMMPYMSDPFRGTVERRVLTPEDSILDLEYRTACDALAAAKLSAEEVDLMLVTSLFPDHLLPGDAAFLAGKLGLKGAAWNVESTCTSGLVSLQTACSLVRTGEYRNVLIVVATNYSRITDPYDSLAFLSGDGIGAFVIGTLEESQGILGTKVINTAETCGAFYQEFTEKAPYHTYLRTRKNTGKMFVDTTVKFLRNCCEGAAAEAGVSFDDIDFFVFNTPTAWYAKVCTRALGVDPKRTINLNPIYGNIGPAFPFANLYHAAQWGKIQENDLVLVYTMGSSSNGAATVMRWGQVALGPAPSPALSLSKEPQEKILVHS